MTDHDPIAHLDFTTPDFSRAFEQGVAYQNLETERIRLLKAFLDYLFAIETTAGTPDADDIDAYTDRLLTLGAHLPELSRELPLQTGDIIEFIVPKIVYPAGFATELEPGQAIRARYGELAVYPHYDIAHDGQMAPLIQFGLNATIGEPALVTSDAVTPLEGMHGQTPLISLHDQAINLRKVTIT